MSTTALGFLGIYALGLFLAFFRHPIFGLGTYLWAFYMHPPTRWWGESLPDLRWSLMAALVTLIATARMQSSVRSSWHANWGARLLIMYTAWMWLQNVWAINSPISPDHLEGCILYTKYVVLFYLIYRIVSDATTFELFAWGHIIGCFIFGWIAYGMPLSGRLENVGGPGMDDANILAMHQLTGLAFASFFFLGMRSKKRWVALAAIPFILNSIVQTTSRGAFLGMMGAGLAALFLGPRGKRLIVCGAIVLGGILFFRLSHELFWERMGTLMATEESQMEGSQRSRIELLRYGWEMVQDYPWGAGYHGHRALSPRYLPEHLLPATNPQLGRGAHNTFMAALVEQGYLGAILYIALQVWIFLSLFRLKPLDKGNPLPSLAIYRAALGTALIACFICGQFLNILYTEVQIWLIALLAVLKSLYHESVPTEVQATHQGTGRISKLQYPQTSSHTGLVPRRTPLRQPGK